MHRCSEDVGVGRGGTGGGRRSYRRLSAGAARSPFVPRILASGSARPPPPAAPGLRGRVAGAAPPRPAGPARP